MCESEPSKATNLKEIINDVKAGIITRVQVCPKELEVMYIANSNIDVEDLAFDIGCLWGFGGQRTKETRFKSKYNTNQDVWHNVTHIYPFSTNVHRAVFLNIENSRDTLSKFPSQSLGNCFFAEFYKPKYHSAATAIEKLNQSVSISIPPPPTEIALGVGSSIAFKDGMIAYPIIIKITSKIIARE